MLQRKSTVTRSRSRTLALLAHRHGRRRRADALRLRRRRRQTPAKRCSLTGPLSRRRDLYRAARAWSCSSGPPPGTQEHHSGHRPVAAVAAGPVRCSTARGSGAARARGSTTAAWARQSREQSDCRRRDLLRLGIPAPRANLDLDPRYKELLRQARRQNVSFYPITPGGLQAPSACPPSTGAGARDRRLAARSPTKPTVSPSSTPTI